MGRASGSKREPERAARAERLLPAGAGAGAKEFDKDDEGDDDEDDDGKKKRLIIKRTSKPTEAVNSINASMILDSQMMKMTMTRTS